MDSKKELLELLQLPEVSNIDDEIFKHLHISKKPNEYIISLIKNFNSNKDNYSQEIQSEALSHIKTYLYLFITRKIGYSSKQQKIITDYSKEFLDVVNFITDYFDDFMIEEIFSTIFKITESGKWTMYDKSGKLEKIYEFLLVLFKRERNQQRLINSGYWSKKNDIQNSDTLLGRLLSIPLKKTDNYNTLMTKTYMIFRSFLKYKESKKHLIRWLLLVIKQNEHKAKIGSFLLFRKQTSVGFITNVLGILLRLWDDGSKIPNALNKIRMDYLSSDELGWSDLPSISNYTEIPGVGDIDDGDIVSSGGSGGGSGSGGGGGSGGGSGSGGGGSGSGGGGSSSGSASGGCGSGSGSGYILPEHKDLTKHNFLTKCFFMVHRMAHLGYFPIVEQFKRLKKSKKQIMTFIEEELQNESYTVQRETLLYKMTNSLEIIDKKIKNIHNVLTNPWVYPSINTLYDTTSKWITTLLEKKDIDSYNQIPSIIIDNCLDIHLYQNYNLELPYMNIESTIKMIFCLFDDKKLIRNPYIRGKCLELIVNSRQTCTFTLNIISLHNNFIINLLELFYEAKELSSCRQIQADILLYLVFVINSRGAPFGVVENLVNTNYDIFIKFVFTLVSSMNSIFDLICDALKKILKNRINIKMKRGDILELSRNISMSKDGIKFCSMFFSKCLNVLELFVKRPKTKQIVLNTQNVSKLAITINYYIKKLMKPSPFPEDFDISSSDLDVDTIVDDMFYVNMDNTIFNRTPILKKIFKLLIRLNSEEEFKTAMVEEDCFYDNTMYREMLNLLSFKKLIRWDEMGVVFEFLELVKTRKEEIIDSEWPEHLDSLIPDDYLCEIMKTPLKNPVQLPGSNEIVEKSVILQHLLSSETNPYTRAPLTKEMLEQHNSKEDVLKVISNILDNFKEWKVKALEEMNSKPTS